MILWLRGDMDYSSAEASFSAGSAGVSGSSGVSSSVTSSSTGSAGATATSGGVPLKVVTSSTTSSAGVSGGAGSVCGELVESGLGSVVGSGAGVGAGVLAPLTAAGWDRKSRSCCSSDSFTHVAPTHSSSVLTRPKLPTFAKKSVIPFAASANHCVSCTKMLLRKLPMNESSATVSEVEVANPISSPSALISTPANVS